MVFYNVFLRGRESVNQSYSKISQVVLRVERNSIDNMC